MWYEVYAIFQIGPREFLWWPHESFENALKHVRGRAEAWAIRATRADGRRLVLARTKHFDCKKAFPEAVIPTAYVKPDDTAYLNRT